MLNAKFLHDRSLIMGQPVGYLKLVLVVLLGVGGLVFTFLSLISTHTLTFHHLVNVQISGVNKTILYCFLNDFDAVTELLIITDVVCKHFPAVGKFIFWLCCC